MTQQQSHDTPAAAEPTSRRAQRHRSSKPDRHGLLPTAAAGAATAGGSSALTVVIDDSTWFGHVLFVVLLVGVVGLSLRRSRVPAPLVCLGQITASLLLLTGAFTEHGLAGIIPGPAAFRELDTLLTAGGTRAYQELPPVEATPAILCLVTTCMAAVAIVVDTLVAHDRAAVAGLPLLGVHAVPVALTDELLPWWTFVLGVAGFAAVLAAQHTHRSRHRHSPPPATGTATVGNPTGPLALLTAALVAGLASGSVFTGIGTVGTLPDAASDGARPVADGGYGIHPFTRLRGLLNRKETVDMFRVHGLGHDQRFLRAFTLSNYRPNQGWTLPTGPMPRGRPASGTLSAPEQVDAGRHRRKIHIEPLNWDDVWLPIYGVPRELRGLAGGWIYDANSGTVFRERSTSPGPYTEIADISQPSKRQLRHADDTAGSVPSKYTDLPHVDHRISRLANRLTANATTRYDKARAVWQHFTPDNGFRYSLHTSEPAENNALVDFLFHGKKGYCEQYASAMAVLLRTLDIPSRVSVGFTTGERDGTHRTITSDDAHAWVEVHFPESGWVSFDPTPLADGREFTPDYLRDESADSAGSATAHTTTPQWQAGSDQPRSRRHPTPDGPGSDATTRQSGLPQHAPDWTVWTSGLVTALALVLTAVTVLVRRRLDNPSTSPTGGTHPMWHAALWLPSAATLTWLLALYLTGWQVHWSLGATLALLGCAAAGPALVRETRLRRRLCGMAAQDAEAPTSAWQELRDTCRDRRVPVAASDTLRTLTRRIAERNDLDENAETALHSIVGVLEQTWYAPAHSTTDAERDTTTLAAAFITLRDSWRHAAALPLREKLLPRSVRESVSLAHPARERGHYRSSNR